jgi:hypothetical protein
VAALAVVVSIVAIGLSGGGSSGGGSGSSVSAPGSVSDPGSVTDPASVAPSTAADPASKTADVAAARACEAFVVYLGAAQKGSIPAAVGRTLIGDAGVLLQGARQDKAANRALPAWSALAADLLAAAEDVVSHKSAALATDGAAAGALCRTVPAAAASAGGFQRTA